MLQATLDAYAGRELDARRLIAEATEAINHSGSQYLISWMGAASGFLEVSLGNYESALRIFEPELTRLMSTPRATELFVAGWVPDAVEALVHRGHLDDAEPVIRMLEDNGRRLDRAWMIALGARCRAMLLAARGDVDAAAIAVERALREHQRLPMPFERARTLLLLGQIQRRQRAKGASTATLHEALCLFEEIGTPLWADRARIEVSRTKSGARPAAELTPSERRVAELLATGMTRREVAAALFISPKTVEANLARIYRKLGIHSRAELGRCMANP
jgi:DNA-binding CsgD family transcriptional regulator